MKHPMITLATFLLLVLVLGSAGGPAAVLAQTSPSYDLSWHVVAGGGQKVASSAHAVQSTVSQFAIGPAASSHTVGSGYWYGIARAATAGFRIYLPVVLRAYVP